MRESEAKRLAGSSQQIWSVDGVFGAGKLIPGPDGYWYIDSAPPPIQTGPLPRPGWRAGCSCESCKFVREMKAGDDATERWAAVLGLELKRLLLPCDYYCPYRGFSGEFCFEHAKRGW